MRLIIFFLPYSKVRFEGLENTFINASCDVSIDFHAISLLLLFFHDVDDFVDNCADN